MITNNSLNRESYSRRQYLNMFSLSNYSDNNTYNFRTLATYALSEYAQQKRILPIWAIAILD